jgi:DNA polymerase-4
MRKIVHIDMDAFYAAIEQRDDPTLLGRPIAVGSAGGRGVVMTASYEARVFGVRSAMPSAVARRLCPDLLFVPARFAAYKAASVAIRAVLERYTALVEPLSLDEAYLDVTEPLPGPMPAVTVARRLKEEIRAETGLTASAGVSFNKFLATLASDLRKPDGLAVIRPEAAKAFVAGLPIERFHGIGPRTAARLHALGIQTGADLQAMDEAALVARIGRVGAYFWHLAHARDDRPVVADRPRRSLSIETTFATDLADARLLAAELDALAIELVPRLTRAGFRARTLTLKIKYADFRIQTRRTTRPAAFDSVDPIRAAAAELLYRPTPPMQPVRLLGLGVANPVEEGWSRQLDLLAESQG